MVDLGLSHKKLYRKDSIYHDILQVARLPVCGLVRASRKCAWKREIKHEQQPEGND